MAYLRFSLLLLVVCACSARAQDAMSLPANCSDEPAPWSGPRPRLPQVPAPKPGNGSLVGTVRDSTTNRPLVGGVVSLRGTDDSSQRETGVDSVGGFAIRDLPSGTYKIVARAIHYRFQERTVTPTAGRVDTLRIALAYHACWGY
jgi:hypothetical protein